MKCPLLAGVEKKGFHPGGTCFRLESFTPSDRCQGRVKAGAERLNPFRWVMSGGSPVDVYEPCMGAVCSLRVESEHGFMSQKKVGPCPKCRTINAFGSSTVDEDEGGICKCCGQQYVLCNTKHEDRPSMGEEAAADTKGQNRTATNKQRDEMPAVGFCR